MKSFTVFVIVFLMVSVANADCFYCGSRTVCTGESKIEVISKCGPPDGSEVSSVEAGGGSVKAIETFYYNCGKDRFIHILTFEGAVLRSIKTGGYGSGPQKCE